MELVVRKSDLLRELQLFQGIVERNNTIPVLANVLMEAEGEELRFLATDLQVALRSKCPASVSKSGKVTLPAKKLFEIIRVLPETEVRIEQDKSGVKVAADRFDSRIQTMPAEDYPSLPHSTGESSLALPAALLGQMIARTHFATTSDDTRYYLNGVLLVASAGQFSLVATDGHRLSLVQAKRESDGPAEEIRVILPKKTVTELGRLLIDVDGDIQYERQENHLFFTVGDRVLISRVNEGQFPAFERVVPKGNDKLVEFERERLMNALKRVHQPFALELHQFVVALRYHALERGELPLVHTRDEHPIADREEQVVLLALVLDVAVHIDQQPSQFRHGLLRQDDPNLFGRAITLALGLHERQSVTIGGNKRKLPRAGHEEHAVEVVAGVVARGREVRARDHLAEKGCRQRQARLPGRMRQRRIILRRHRLDARVETVGRNFHAGLVLLDADLGLRKHADDLEKLLRRQRDFAALRHRRGALAAQRHLEVGGQESKLLALGLHQNVGEDGNRVVPLDDSLEELQFTQ